MNPFLVPFLIMAAFVWVMTAALALLFSFIGFERDAMNPRWMNRLLMLPRWVEYILRFLAFYYAIFTFGIIFGAFAV